MPSTCLNIIVTSESGKSRSGHARHLLQAVIGDRHTGAVYARKSVSLSTSAADLTSIALLFLDDCRSRFQPKSIVSRCSDVLL